MSFCTISYFVSCILQHFCIRITNFSQTWHLRHIQDAIFILQLLIALCFFMSFLPALGTCSDRWFGSHRGNRASGIGGKSILAEADVDEVVGVES